MQIIDNSKVVDGEAVPLNGTVVFDEATYAFQEVTEREAERLFSHDASPEFTAIKRGETFKILFETSQYAPNHVVTLRNEEDGWGKDIYGVYAFGLKG